MAQVGVRLKVLRLMKELLEAEHGREAIGATSHGNAVAKPLGEVDWQMTQGGEWFRNDPLPTVSSPRLTGVALGEAPLHVIDPWDYTEMEFTQKYGAEQAQHSPAVSQRAASPALSAASARSGSSSRGGSPSPQPQPEPEPEPEQSSPSLKSRAPPIPRTASGGSAASATEEVVVIPGPAGGDESFDAPWENDSDDEQPAPEPAAADEEDDGVRPWFRRAVMTE